MRLARGAGLWISWCRMSMTLDIYFASWFLAGGVSEFLVSGAKTHHKTAEALGQVTWCGWGQWTPWRAHHFENLPYDRTKNCLIPGIKMHKSLRYQKAQQEMVDIQHFNQQEREDCQNCKTSLSYCRTSAVVSGKAIPTNCSQLGRLKVQEVYLMFLLNTYHHDPPTQLLEDYIAFG